MKTDAAPWPNSQKSIAVALLLAALLCFFLLVTSHSPRGRVNVMLFTAAAFFLLVLARSWGRLASGAPALPGSSGYRGMWMAMLLGTAVWSFSFPVGFINDDFGLVYTAGRLDFWQFIQSQSGVFFRPLGYASIFLDYRVWGMWAPGYHLTNIALHLAAIAGLYCLCTELGADEKTCTIAALIYAVLPVHAEEIAWIGCRFGLLSDALVICSAVLYLKSRRMEAGRAIAYSASLLCFALAAVSKESAFVFPALIVLMEGFFAARRRILPVLGFFATAAAIFAGRWMAMGGIGGYTTPLGGAPATLDINFKTFEGLLIRAPGVMLFGYNWLQPPLAVMAVLASLTGGMLLLLGWLSRKAALERGILALSVAWMIVAVAPAHPLLMIGGDLTNSRNLHPGTVGLALLLAHVISKAVPTGVRRVPVALLVALLSLGSLANIAAWRWSSRLTGQLVADVQRLEPAPAPRTAFVIYNVPQTVRGVFLLHEGLGEALRLAYGREDLNARHAGPNDSGEVLIGPVVRLEWQGETEPHLRLVQNSPAGN